MEGIIQNGLNSIRVGLEDYEQALTANDDARLTSAVRNVYAGILILAKGKLYELSPTDTRGILIRVVRPKLVKGRIEVVPVGRKTIGYEEIKQRFEDSELSLDWARIERVRTIRNDLEHFYHDGARANVQEALADAAIVIHSLLALLNLDPVRDLGERWWEVLLRNEKLFAAELEACRKTISGVRWINQAAKAASEHFSCEQCGSLLIRQTFARNEEQDNIHVNCAACGAESDMKALMERAVTQQYYRELYETHTRGGELPVVYCPECRLYALIIEANECAVCGNCLDPLTPDSSTTLTTSG
ncbi:MAG: hypothetical protein O7G83_12865 [Proteobacteria bacterium]|nr:hypothetical protein [Pseudomonadota bacterium]